MAVEQDALGSETRVRERGRMKPAGVHVRTDDGVELALHRVSGAVWQACPVLLTHGTFSNGQVCAGLAGFLADHGFDCRSEEHTSELQSRLHLVCRLLLEKKKKTNNIQ